MRSTVRNPFTLVLVAALAAVSGAAPRPRPATTFFGVVTAGGQNTVQWVRPFRPGSRGRRSRSPRTADGHSSYRLDVPDDLPETAAAVVYFVIDMPDFNSVRHEFSVRLYQWALADALREAELGFPLISTLASSHSQSFLWQLQNTTLVLLDPLSPTEVAMLDSFDERRMYWPTTKLNTGRVKLGKLSNLVGSAFPAIHGDRCRPIASEPKSHSFFLTVEQFIVKTEIVFDRPIFYRHHIYAEGEEISTNMSIFAWVGIASLTDFDLAEKGAEELVVTQLAESITRFLAAVPALVEDLLNVE